MNLHGIAGPIVAAVNPTVTVTVWTSTGSTTGADGRQTPTYASRTAQAQIQALTYRDLVQTDGLNMNGVKRAVYFYGDVEGIVRSADRGGDLVTFPDDTVWLVAMVLEAWPDWCKVAVVLQTD